MVSYDLCAIFRHTVYLRLGFDARCQIVQFADVTIVHAYDEVKLLKIGNVNWS